MGQGLDSFFPSALHFGREVESFVPVKCEFPPYRAIITGLLSFGKRSPWDLTLQKPLYCGHPLQFALRGHRSVLNNVPPPPRRAGNKRTVAMRPHGELGRAVPCASPEIATRLGAAGDLLAMGAYRCAKNSKIRSSFPRDGIFFPSSHEQSCPNPSLFSPESFLFPFSWTRLQNPFIFLFSLLSVMLLHEA